MTMPRACVAVAATMLFLGGCASPLTRNINVDSQVSAGTDFAALKTYQWLATAQILNDPNGQWEPRGFDADAEIRFLINRELRAHGISEVASNPDLLVAYVAGVDMDAMGWKKDPQTKLSVLANEPEGALAVVLLNATTGDAVWGAVASDNVQGTLSAEDAKKRLDYAVSKMFARLPGS